AVVTGAAGLSALCAGAVAPETGAIGRRGLVGVVHAGGSGRVAVLAIFPRRAQYDDVWFHFRRLVKVGVWFVGTRGDGVLRLLLEIDTPGFGVRSGVAIFAGRPVDARPVGVVRRNVGRRHNARRVGSAGPSCAWRPAESGLSPET